MDYHRPVEEPQVERPDVTVRCEVLRVEMAPDSSALRLEITCDDELLTYCEACWESEFGDD